MLQTTALLSTDVLGKLIVSVWKQNTNIVCDLNLPRWYSVSYHLSLEDGGICL